MIEINSLVATSHLSSKPPLDGANSLELSAIRVTIFSRLSRVTLLLGSTRRMYPPTPAEIEEDGGREIASARCLFINARRLQKTLKRSMPSVVEAPTSVGFFHHVPPRHHFTFRALPLIMKVAGLALALLVSMVLARHKTHAHHVLPSVGIQDEAFDGVVALAASARRRPAAHALTGYWHNFQNPAGPTYPLRQISADWDVIVVAFGESLGGGRVGFTVDPATGSETQFIADVAALQQKGKTVVLSLGGQNGAVSLANADETANFVQSVLDLLEKFGFDGIDLDLETGISQGLPIVTNLVYAVKQLKQMVGERFYLSMAPEHPYVQGGAGAYGSIWGAYLPIIDGLRDELTQIHVQYYNNGGFVYTDGRMLQEGTVDALVGGSVMLIEGFQTNYGSGWAFKGLRPDQVSFGVPSGPQAAGRGQVTSEVVTRALSCLSSGVHCDTIQPKQPYPTFRGVMTWSINWDSHDGYVFSKNARHALDSMPSVTSTSPTVAPARARPSTQKATTTRPTTPAPTTPNCGTCANCYFAPTNACFTGWTVEQCASVSSFTWCGAH
ncbi:Aste57867_11971 [Aphanomyces stellatus]|uniref:chitinase n=1 Tax=Aphanomyces stellatus TaxID=120398 RepID=A0A485KV59_9STRA|nr:hypothetical protein As57867_011926 [Aphanomyces stellatus]VFT88826.1 Aste57867_11971 [Aphanomyces stellatus]